MVVSPANTPGQSVLPKCFAHNQTHTALYGEKLVEFEYKVECR